MSRGHVRVGVGTRFAYDGQIVEVVELRPAAHGLEVVISDGQQARRIALGELLGDHRARVIPQDDGPAGDDQQEAAATLLAELDEGELGIVRERAEHVREILTGYRSGSAQLSTPGEPRAEFDPKKGLEQRYKAKAAELGIDSRTVKRWVREYRRFGEAGLVPTRRGAAPDVDKRWLEAALQVMVEHTEKSRPTRSAVIRKARQRVEAQYGPGVVKLPAKATAYRELRRLDKRHPTFRLSTNRNRDIASRPAGPYGKLRPTRPGEYLAMDTTRLDVFALDPVTLRWLQVELTVAMCWYTKCVVGLLVTPVSTKAIDAAAVLYQSFRPLPAPQTWPAHAVWPEHGIPRSVVIDHDALARPGKAAAGPAIAPETIVIDHGKIYVSEHLTSVCARMGISIQPARLRTGRDKAPVERFFRTIREDLLQHLDGYKGPDLFSRGVNVEAEAFYYLDELEDIIREWVAAVYHHRPHGGLVEPGLPSARMTPAMMYEHGLARSGYLEVPRDPELAFEFLKVEARTIQHYGVEIAGRRYNGAALNPYRGQESPYTGRLRGLWPIHVDPDDITHVYFRDPETRRWHALTWEHAAGLNMPLSDEALRFARRLAAQKHRFVDDRLALDELLARWQEGVGGSVAERRLLLRMARKHKPLSDDIRGRASADPTPELESEQPTAAGDDDLEGDLDDDYYNDAIEEA